MSLTPCYAGVSFPTHLFVAVAGGHVYGEQSAPVWMHMYTGHIAVGGLERGEMKSLRTGQVEARER